MQTDVTFKAAPVQAASLLSLVIASLIHRGYLAGYVGGYWTDPKGMTLVLCYYFLTVAEFDVLWPHEPVCLYAVLRSYYIENNAYLHTEV